MSKKFKSVDDVKKFMASKAGIDMKSIEEFAGLCVMGMDSVLLDDPRTKDFTKEQIVGRIDAQKGFKFIALNGDEIKFVVGHFRDGFDCWILGKDGFAYRI